VIEQWAKLKYGVHVPRSHTPSADSLNFNAHLQVLVSAGGLQESDGRWVNSLAFRRHPPVALK